MLTYETIFTALEEQPLFDEKTWRLSPDAWPLNAKEAKEVARIGQACLEFYRAVELLYTRSWQNKNLMRNRELKAPWVAEYLDRGKPEPLIEHSRSKKLRAQTPLVIRPDLLMTDKGWALTEIDSVPGGIGLTAFLNRLYEESEGDSVIGSGNRMVSAFYESLAALAPDKNLPLIAILVSDEAATYRPEMQWLAESLQVQGKRVYCFHTSEIMPLGESLCVDLEGNPEQVDVIYRFWELFDHPNIPEVDYTLRAWEQDAVQISPPMRHFQEEKLNLALFHHPILEDFWRENLSKQSYRLFSRIVPQSWVVDPVDLPPNAVLHAPHVGGRPIWKWEQLGEASQKERNLILKISGYHEEAWGARSVIFGGDVSRTDWQEGIAHALEMSDQSLYILQEYRKPKRLRHTVYKPDGDGTFEMEGRLRLCPYYFVSEDNAELCGALATFCPADKKIIHGMSDAAMLPCKVVEEEE